LVNLARDEVLCQAFEVYQQLMPSHGISFEHAVFLNHALAAGEELTLGRCEDGGAFTVIDRTELKAWHCSYCAS
jgi:hypothetical protein